MEATASSYIEHAKEMNVIARSILKPYLAPKKGVVNGLSGKISLGLSLQAGELAGKGMLRALGFSVDQIKKQHSRHNLLALCKHVQSEIEARPEKELEIFRNFLLWTPIIDDVLFGSTLGEYLVKHFSKGASAQPRSYFYPDLPEFTGPKPFHALLIMIDHLINLAEQLTKLLCPKETVDC
jgi:hypothetical protein